MTEPQTSFRCIQCGSLYPLSALVYECSQCHGLLEVYHPPDTINKRTPEQWRHLFEQRPAGRPGPDGSGVWRYHEWVLPDLPAEHIVTLGEGATALTHAQRTSEQLGVRLYIKQCGHTVTGSFKDLGMTVLISQVRHMRELGHDVPAVACASTGDTSAALAAYGAAAGIRALVLLPAGKISAAQLVQPLAHGARVLAVNTDFDGCMRHVQKLTREHNVYLANSKNSLRIEGQKTVAFEIAQGLATSSGWDVPDWVAIPGGNLGNVSALVAGFRMLRHAGLTARLPRILCAQSERASPLHQSFLSGFAPLAPMQAGETQASAIRIGNPVSFDKAVRALKEAQGVVTSVSERELTAASRDADSGGLYTCPHTAVALGAVRKELERGTIRNGERVVVVATAHGLKFTEFKQAMVEDRVPDGKTGQRRSPIEVPDDFAAVRRAALETAAS